MRLAVYKDNLSTGRGADRAVRNFAADMAERGHEITLFEKAMLIEQLQNTYDALIVAGSNEIVDLDKLGYFSRPDRAKVILQCHLAPRGFFKWRHPFRNRAIKNAFNKADAVQVLCESYEAEFHALAPKPKVVTIGNYTEMPTPAETADVISSRTILYPAAALNKIKNQKLLIRAFAVLSSEFPEWKVRLLGKDTTRYADECRMLIEKLGLKKRIEIVGFSKDLSGEYKRSAFVAFPSNLEGFPLAILEAARFGLCAVVQGDLPGVRDIVRDGDTGLVAENDVKAYSAALRRLMSNRDCCQALGSRARIYCENHYSREKILDQWEVLLQKVSEVGV